MLIISIFFDVYHIVLSFKNGVSQSVSYLGNFCPWSSIRDEVPCRKHLAFSGNMFGGWGGCSWDAVGRGQGEHYTHLTMHTVW